MSAPLVDIEGLRVEFGSSASPIVAVDGGQAVEVHREIADGQ